MGRHIQLDGPTSGSPGGNPPQPKGGEVPKSCKQLPDWSIYMDFTPEELAKMKENNSSPTKYFAPGAGPFNLYVYPSFEGEPINYSEGGQPEGESGPPSGKLQEQGDQKERVRGEMDPGWNRAAGPGFVTRGTNELKGPVTESEVKIRDPKKDSLRKKIKKKIEDTPLDEAVHDIVSENIPGINTYYIEDFSTIIVEDMTFQETFVSTALNRLSLLGQADWMILGDEFWFFRPEDHFNTEDLTTQAGHGSTLHSFAPGYGPSVPGPSFPPPPPGTPTIQRGTAKRTDDTSEQKNVVQVFNPKKKTPRQETPLYYDDEAHISYPPAPEEGFDVYYFHDGEIPYLEQIPVFEHWIDDTDVAPYSAPQISGPTFSVGTHTCVAWLDMSNCGPCSRIFRLTTSEDPPVRFTMPPPWIGPPTDSLFVDYYYEQTEFYTVSDPESIAEYGELMFRIVTPAGHSSQEMRALAEAILREYSQPRTHFQCCVFAPRYELGDSVNVNVPELDLNNQVMPIWKTVLRFDMKNKDRYFPGIQELHLGKKPMEIGDFLGQYLEDRIAGLEEPYYRTRPPLRDVVVYREEITLYEQYRFEYSEPGEGIGTSVIGTGTIGP